PVLFILRGAAVAQLPDLPYEMTAKTFISADRELPQPPWMRLLSFAFGFQPLGARKSQPRLTAAASPRMAGSCFFPKPTRSLDFAKNWPGRWSITGIKTGWHIRWLRLFSRACSPLPAATKTAMI